MANAQGVQDNSEIGALMHDCWTDWGHSGAPLVERGSGSCTGMHSSWDDDTGMRRAVAWEVISAFPYMHCVRGSGGPAGRSDCALNASHWQLPGIGDRVLQSSSRVGVIAYHVHDSTHYWPELAAIHRACVGGLVSCADEDCPFLGSDALSTDSMDRSTRLLCDALISHGVQARSFF